MCVRIYVIKSFRPLTELRKHLYIRTHQVYTQTHSTHAYAYRKKKRQSQARTRPYKHPRTCTYTHTHTDIQHIQHIQNTSFFLSFPPLLFVSHSMSVSCVSYVVWKREKETHTHSLFLQTTHTHALCFSLQITHTHDTDIAS